MRIAVTLIIAALFLSSGIASASAERKVPQEGPASGEKATVPQKIDINRATREQLVDVPGIGPETAQGIVDLRSNKGSFIKIEELLEVRGIKEKKLAAITQYLSLIPLEQSAGATQGQ